MTAHVLATWAIAALATAGVILRPRGWPEAIWAVSGAAVLVASGLLGAREAAGAVAGGLDVYLFLAGMMLLGEVARRERLFDWLAAVAVRRARGSPTRLLLIVYAVGTAVTALLSNDAAAVVLTPAVLAATRAAKVEPLPHLLACAFVANAASFVLPISNPANLVLFGGRMPPLADWVGRFALPSALSVVATLAALWLVERGRLGARFSPEIERVALPPGGVVAACGIGATGIALLASSAAGIRLGAPTAIAGTATAVLVLLRGRASPRAVLSGISWGILPLVAGLFVLVDGVRGTGAIAAIGEALARADASDRTIAAAAAGIAAALATDLANNLPVGLVASGAAAAAHAPPEIADSLLIGVDLGPNLSVTGSLATILWLAALRREGERVGFLAFLARGVAVMPVALALALAARLLRG